MEAELLDPEAREGSKRKFEDLLALVRTWAFMNPDLPDQASMIFDDSESAGPLTDFFVFHFLKKAPEKQVYLDILDPVQRVEKFAEHQENDLLRLSRKWEKRTRATVIH